MSRDNEDRLAPLDGLPTISTGGSGDVDSGVRRDGHSSDGGEFFAGQLIAGRFRVVSRLGSDGIGDVYRADDY